MAYRDHELVAGDIASCVYEVTETAVLVAQIGHALMIEDSEMRRDERAIKITVLRALSAQDRLCGRDVPG